MIYTELTKLVMKVAYESHKDQVDKSGMSYIYHPVHLAEQMAEEYVICVALLHDTVEDTDMTFEKLERIGFPEEITEALRLLTHDDAVPYMEYVKLIKDNELARKVKLVDLAHNSDLSRLNIIDDKVMQRVEKYKTAMELLSK